MAPDRRHRYSSAGELADELRAVRTLRATVARPLSAADRILRRVRRSPRSIATTVAIVLLCVVVTLLAVQNRGLRHRSEAGGALLGVLDATTRDQAPSPMDLEVLRRHFPDQRSFDIAIAACAERDLRTLVVTTTRALENVFRSTTGTESRIRLIRPRASIATTRPRFLFAVPDATDALEMVLNTASGESSTWPIAPAAQHGEGMLELPAGIELAPGAQYAWTVRAAGGDHAREDSAHAASFRVVPEADVARLRASLPATGDAWLDAVTAACALTRDGPGGRRGRRARALFRPVSRIGATAPRAARRRGQAPARLRAGRGASAQLGPMIRVRRRGAGAGGSWPGGAERVRCRRS